MDAERVFHEDAEPQAGERLQDCRSLEWSLAYYDDEIAGRRLSDPEEILYQISDDRRGHRCSEYGEPQSPPPPYSQHDQAGGGGEGTLPNEGFNLYPGEDGRAVYITDSLGRRERYVENGYGERVPWPLPDLVDSSDDGDGDADMVHLETGRIIPRSEWEADHERHPSSDEPSSDGMDAEFSQSHRYPMPRTRTPPYWTQEHELSHREVPRIRSGRSPASRRSGRQCQSRRERRPHHSARERPRHQDPLPGHRSGHH